MTLEVRSASEASLLPPAHLLTERQARAMGIPGPKAKGTEASGLLMTDGSPKEARKRGVTETETMARKVLVDVCARLDLRQVLISHSPHQCPQVAKVAE